VAGRRCRVRDEGTKALERQTRITLARNAAQTATARRGLALSGAAGLGKTTAALLIGKRHEKRMRGSTVSTSTS
jgi:MoxR-like ATPase